MRISADTASPAFSPLAAYASVWLNGLPVEDCVMADDELGEVFCLLFDAQNKPMTNEFDEVLTVRHQGNVEIRIVQ